MEKKAIYKIPGGKMIRVLLEYEDNTIKNIKITGDFFLYPEEGINLLEKGLKNISLDGVPAKIEDIIKNNNLTLFGLTTEGITEVIKLAILQ